MAENKAFLDEGHNRAPYQLKMATFLPPTLNIRFVWKTLSNDYQKSIAEKKKRFSLLYNAQILYVIHNSNKFAAPTYKNL